MKSVEVIKELADLRGDAAVIVGPGMNSGLLYQQKTHAATIYDMELGYATAVCLGLALATPNQRVVAIEGDGSMVAGIGSLSTVARYSPENLVVIVLNNGVYGTTGDGLTKTAAGVCLDLPGVARSSGISAEHVISVDDITALRSAVARAMQAAGPWIIIAKITETTGGTRRQYPVPDHDLVECSIAFRLEMTGRGYGSNR